MTPPPEPAAVLAIAHRGDPVGHRENTLPAFAAAVAQGADMVELDLRRTGDGAIVVLHDQSLLRLWGLDVSVGELDLSAVTRLGDGDVRIPTLRQVIDAVPPRLDLMVDFTRREVVAGALDQALEADALDRCLFVSRNVEALRLLRGLSGRARIGLTWTDGDDPPLGRLDELGAESWNPMVAFVTESGVDAVHRAGRLVSTWTVDEPSDMASRGTRPGWTPWSATGWPNWWGSSGARCSRRRPLETRRNETATIRPSRHDGHDHRTAPRALADEAPEGLAGVAAQHLHVVRAVLQRLRHRRGDDLARLGEELLGLGRVDPAPRLDRRGPAEHAILAVHRHDDHDDTLFGELLAVTQHAALDVVHRAVDVDVAPRHPPVAREIPLASSVIASPSSHSSTLAGSRPIERARRAWWTMWRYSPWTGTKHSGLVTDISVRSSPWRAWPLTCTRSAPECTTSAPRR